VSTRIDFIIICAAEHRNIIQFLNFVLDTSKVFCVLLLNLEKKNSKTDLNDEIPTVQFMKVDCNRFTG